MFFVISWSQIKFKIELLVFSLNVSLEMGLLLLLKKKTRFFLKQLKIYLQQDKDVSLYILKKSFFVVVVFVLKRVSFVND